MRPIEYTLFVNNPGLSWEVGFVPGVSGPEILGDSWSMLLDTLAWVISTALLWIRYFCGGRANYCNFGLCCQQPQRSPQAMMETLLAVAVHHPDGRVVTSTLPSPSICAVSSSRTVPAVCPHKAEQSHQLSFPLCWSLVLLLVSVAHPHPASFSL